MKTFIKKLGYCFSIETTKIDNGSLPLKTVLSEANVKTNRIATTKWIKIGVLPVTTLFIFGNLFQF